MMRTKMRTSQLGSDKAMSVRHVNRRRGAKVAGGTPAPLSFQKGAA
jgi:hypothetical protein